MAGLRGGDGRHRDHDRRARRRRPLSRRPDPARAGADAQCAGAKHRRPAAGQGCYRPLPTNTDDAIVSGALHATLGAIDRMRSTLGGDALCLLSGGAAAELAPHLDLPHCLIDHLVLEGLARYGATLRSNGLGEL
jgi:hypothetical protein